MAADEVIDASGLVVAPGFIDTHSHSDLQILTDPYVKPKVMQGITTEILGQDGISMAPLPVEYISPWRKNLAGLDGDSDEINWEYKTTEGYLKMVEEAKPGLNECYLVPHGNIRMEAMGLENRLPNEEELEKMRQITRREMEAGAIGLSTGLIYMPCAYSESKEIIEMCKVVAEYDGRFVIHQRSEADTILDSMMEVIKIGRESGVKIHYQDDNYLYFLSAVPVGMLPSITGISDQEAYLSNETVQQFSEEAAVIEKAVAEGRAIGFEHGPSVQAGLLTSQGVVEEMFQDILINGTDIPTAAQAAEDQLNEIFETMVG